MDPIILTALISAISTVVVAGIGAIPALSSMNKKLNVVGEQVSNTNTQVTNTHETNLRDDVTEVLNAVNKATDILEQHTEILLGHTKDIRFLHQEDARLRGRLERLEQPSHQED